MILKTPQFNKALNRYFSELELDDQGGQWRTCRFSGEKFYVRPEDIEFYKEIKVPLPTLSLRERSRVKLAFLNVYNLFKTKSSFSGKQIISLYPPSTPYKIYEHQAWFGDEWDPLDYGVDYDRNSGFFKQFQKLQYQVPLPNLLVDSTSVNCDYATNIRRSKNCYLVFGALNSEDSAHSIELIDSRNCYDCFTVFNSDTCYDCFESSYLYRCFYVEYSRHCLDSYFLFDCRNCEHCFGCTNLRNKKYYFFNKALSKETYQKEIGKFNLGDRDVINSLKDKFEALKKQAFYKQNHNDRTVGSQGDFLKDSKNCYFCFYSMNSQNLTYCTGGIKNRDSYDLIGGVGTELSYESAGGGTQNQRIMFTSLLNACRDMEYSKQCTNCHNCFGCIGLRNKSFFIFNKQYSEKDYWKKIDEIKINMFKNGEYGEFFPPTLSTFPYNVSLATSFKGYDDIDLAKQYGYNIEDITHDIVDSKGEVIDSRSLPKDIKDVKDDILKKQLFDQDHKRKFIVIKSELEFYKRHNIPLPLHHPIERLSNKRKKLGTLLFELYERKCDKCNKRMQTVYAPDRKEIVYCEVCYQQEVV